VPKVEEPDDLRFVDRLLGMVEEETGRERPVAIEALIETAAGLARVRDIARGSDRLEALIVGYADLGASLGRSSAAGEHWSPVLDTVLVAARATGLQAIDGPHLDIPDLDGMRAAAARARVLGYDGKWALHPTQVEPLNEIFSATDEELERAGAVIAALDRAASGPGSGAALLDGEMIDEASRKRALGVLARGSAARG
jgi:citrate lyase subunit beta/citryl-CoA lyase